MNSGGYEDVRAGSLTLGLALVITLLIALALVTAGCVLVYLGAVGHTEVALFGTTLNTASVGVVGIVCGTVLGIINTRRTLKALETLATISLGGIGNVRQTPAASIVPLQWEVPMIDLTPFILASPAHLKAAKTVMIGVLVVTSLLGLAIVVSGCVLIYWGSTGYSEITLFGNKLNTSNIGAVGIVCGSVLTMLNIRGLLKTLERLGAL
jgi:hypothetical protein